VQEVRIQGVFCNIGGGGVTVISGVSGVIVGDGVVIAGGSAAIVDISNPFELILLLYLKFVLFSNNNTYSITK